MGEEKAQENVFDRLAHALTGRKMLVITLLFFLVSWYALCVFEPYLTAVANGNGHVEQAVFYTPDQLYALAGNYGDAGRALYVNVWPLSDTICLLAYGVFFSCGILFFGKALKHRRISNKVACILQLAGMGLDVLENTFCCIFLAVYPQRLDAIAVLATTSSICKTVVNVTVMAIFAVRLVEWIVSKIKG